MVTPKLSETDAAVRWIKQFKVSDQALMAAMLDEMTLVTHAEFWERLRALVVASGARIDGPVGLYAEREVPWRNKLFAEPRRKPRRAEGPGPRPVSPRRTKGPEVGSEGIIANLITELCREDPDKFRSHPGPDEIREDRIRAFFLITDFIGSGGRARAYLEAAWRVASVKSWHSFGWLRFEVLSYSATEVGSRLVRTHGTKPSITIVLPCPTIESAFGSAADDVYDLCVRYDPVRRDREDSLGYGGVGALIAFAHGCPNNAPRILHRSCRGRWEPLFPRRVTARSRAMFGDRRDAATLAKRLERLGEMRLATSDWLAHAGQKAREIVAVLAAARRGPRRDDTIARRTGLTIPEVRVLTAHIVGLGWMDVNRCLTDAGMGQLSAIRSYRKKRFELPNEPGNPYYPKSLRVP